MKKVSKIIVGVATVAIMAAAAALVLYAFKGPGPIPPPTVAGKLILKGVTVIDPKTGALTPGMSIMTDAGRIVSIGPGDPAPGDTSVQRINATGKFVAPGFNDMHAHPLGPKDPSGDLALMLANGITGFRQMQGSDTLLDQRRTRTLPIGQEAPAPLVMPGSLLTPVNAGTIKMATRTVQEQKASGADFIKVGMVSRPVLFAVLAEAKKVDLPVAGHVPPSTDVVAAARAGMRAIEHLGPSDGALVACSSQRDVLRRELDAEPDLKGLPFKMPFAEAIAQKALSRLIMNPAAATTPDDTRRRRALVTSFDELQCREVARQLVQAGNWQVPTLIRRKSTEQADAPAFANDPNLRFMPPKTVALWRDVTADYVKKVPASARQLYRDDYGLDLRVVKIFDEEGVPMLAGSDVSGVWEVPGFSLHQEFDELAKAGLSPLRILQMTTSDAAQFLGRTDHMGRVAAGYDADLVLLDGDPTKDVANLHRVSGVVRAGHYYGAQQLHDLKERVAAGGGYLK